MTNAFNLQNIPLVFLFIISVHSFGAIHHLKYLTGPRRAFKIFIYASWKGGVMFRSASSTTPPLLGAARWTNPTNGSQTLG